MSRWELIDTATVPGGGEELRLHRHGDTFTISVAGRGELMNTRTHGSEDALGALACEGLAGRSGVRVLIGGLGMGFTLASALRTLAADAEVVVAELVPGVVRWNEGSLGACAGYPLRDPRVSVREVDVGALLRKGNATYDAIALDVDNGPEGLTRDANDRLYSLAGLADANRALRKNGTLAVWSAGPDAPFTGRLRKIGFRVEERKIRAHAGKGARHIIWLAHREA